MPGKELVEEHQLAAQLSAADHRVQSAPYIDHKDYNLTLENTFICFSV